MPADLLKMLLKLDGIKAYPIPMMDKDDRLPFLTEVLRRIETAKTLSDWTDVEVAIAVNLAEKDIDLVLVSLFTGSQEFVKKHAYSLVDESGRVLAKKMLGEDIGILAKLQKNGHWTVKLTWVGGEVTCPSQRHFNIPQSILWCVISALIVEARKDGAS